MTKHNGQEIIQVEDADCGLRWGSKGEGDQNLKMNAHLDAFFVRRGLPIQEFGFRQQAHAEILNRRRRKTR